MWIKTDITIVDINNGTRLVEGEDANVKEVYQENDGLIFYKIENAANKDVFVSKEIFDKHCKELKL
jgi:hypothetical protein